jgi:hypothetical protein
MKNSRVFFSFVEIPMISLINQQIQTKTLENSKCSNSDKNTGQMSVWILKHLKNRVIDCFFIVVDLPMISLINPQKQQQNHREFYIFGFFQIYGTDVGLYFEKFENDEFSSVFGIG